MESTAHPTHVEVALTARDLEDLIEAITDHLIDYGGYDPPDNERKRALRSRLRILREALP